MKIYLVIHEFAKPGGDISSMYLPRGFNSELKAKKAFEETRRIIMDKWRRNKEWGKYEEYDDGGCGLFVCSDPTTHEEESVELFDVKIED